MPPANATAWLRRFPRVDKKKKKKTGRESSRIFSSLFPCTSRRSHRNLVFCPASPGAPEVIESVVLLRPALLVNTMARSGPTSSHTGACVTVTGSFRGLLDAVPLFRQNGRRIGPSALQVFRIRRALAGVTVHRSESRNPNSSTTPSLIHAFRPRSDSSDARRHPLSGNVFVQIWLRPRNRRFPPGREPSEAHCVFLGGGGGGGGFWSRLLPDALRRGQIDLCWRSEGPSVFGFIPPMLLMLQTHPGRESAVPRSPRPRGCPCGPACVTVFQPEMVETLHPAWAGHEQVRIRSRREREPRNPPVCGSLEPVVPPG